MLTTRNCHFNPRSLTGATFDIHVFSTQISISIHAPSRERRCCSISIGIPHIFQSTLPRGSDCNSLLVKSYYVNFNPRSLAGATGRCCHRGLPCRFQSTLPRGSDVIFATFKILRQISIHAPSRERRNSCDVGCGLLKFQSTLPRGSDLRRMLCLACQH